MTHWTERIRALGAEEAAEIPASAVPLSPAFRADCARNACGFYGRCWTCPPDAGEIGALMERVRGYKTALALTTTHPLTDPFDIEGMHAAAAAHNRVVRACRDLVREAREEECLALGAGACGFCGRCAKDQDAPCRFPEEALLSLEACGVDASALAKACGLSMTAGKDRMVYLGVILVGTGKERATVTAVRPDGTEKQIVCRTGESLLSILQGAGLAPDAPCGGRGTCGRCRVTAHGSLSPMEETERALLCGADGDTRLACRALVTGDCRVLLADAGAPQAAVTPGVGMPQNPLYGKLGAAVDLGTTTLAARLYDRTGLILELSKRNPQCAYGADVVTRLGAAMEGRAPALQTAAARGISDLLTELAAAAGADEQDIDTLVLSGNTAMLTLIAGGDPAPLTRPPFAPGRSFGEWVDADRLGLTICARCYLPPCPSGYVGADALLSVHASGMTEREETALLADVGTNGELALWHRGKLLTASAPAGPAFEGANLSCGCLGALGAVDRVWTEDGRLRCRVIGGGAAKGVCGSGVVDALFAFLRLGRIDATGRICTPCRETAEGPVLDITENVRFTQRDIRNVQLAKSAVYAGIMTLLERAGLTPDDVKRFYLAGGFGSYVDPASAAGIGLFPGAFTNRTRVLGNASLYGAAALLLDGDGIPVVEALARAAKHVELASVPAFMDRYVEGLGFLEAE